MTTVTDTFAVSHVPVMCTEVVDALSPALQNDGAVYVDCTEGLGGHSAAILAANPTAQLIGIDRDPKALQIASERLSNYADRVQLFHAVFDELGFVLEKAGVSHVQAILMDLGLSSMQIDLSDRGFSYMANAPLDMRMDQSQGQTAADIVNQTGEKELIGLLRDLGDEKFAPKIARAVVAAREVKPIETSSELVKIITDAIPRWIDTAGHPAKRTFQALRIATNWELDALRSIMPIALSALGVGGRLAVLSYHSGEDRIVKQAISAAVTDNAPKGVPVVPDAYLATHRSLTRGAERPSAAEVASNPRAASARLRVVERVRS